MVWSLLTLLSGSQRMSAWSGCGGKKDCGQSVEDEKGTRIFSLLFNSLLLSFFLLSLPSSQSLL